MSVAGIPVFPDSFEAFLSDCIRDDLRTATVVDSKLFQCRVLQEIVVCIPSGLRAGVGTHGRDA